MQIQARAERNTLMQRVQALQAQTAHSAREIEATRAAAMTQIADAAQPVIAEVYASKPVGCCLTAVRCLVETSAMT